jgi:subtilisin family serine protease
MAASNTNFCEPPNIGFGSIAGIAHDATIWSYPVFDEGYPGPHAIAQAIDHARSAGIRIVNMSFGTAPTPSLHDAVRNAVNSGMLLIAAPGNWNIDATGCPSYPAGYIAAQPPVSYATSHRVCTVGGMWLDGNRYMDVLLASACDDPGFCPPEPLPICAGSTYGSHLDLAAPGGALMIAPIPDNNYFGFDPNTCDPNDPYTWGFQGTSASAPQVAGIAALLKGRLPILTGEDIEQSSSQEVCKRPQAAAL